MNNIRQEYPPTVSRVIVLLLISGLTAFGQAPVPLKLPTQVVEEFWRVETSGGRLTADGFYESSRFFVRSPLSPPLKVINVIRKGATDSIEETAMTATWAEVSVTTDRLGQIDPLLRFTLSSTLGPGGVMVLKGPPLTFDLVLAEKQWKVNHDGGRALGTDVSRQWLITCGGDTIWINLDTAIAYVKRIRAHARDPDIRRNADHTLQRLVRLK